MGKPAYIDLPGQSEGLGEKGNQRAVAEATPWRLAKDTRGTEGASSREMLDELGFTVVNSDRLFFHVTPPEGWTKNTKGYQTLVRNPEGKIVFEQFYKGAVGDTRADIKRVLG